MDKEYIIPKLKQLCALLYSNVSGEPFAIGDNKKGYTFGVISPKKKVKIENKVTRQVAMYLVIEKIPKNKI